MTPHQAELLEFLVRSKPTLAAKALLKRSAQQFVLDHGWWYEPIEVPRSIATGSIQECHTNAVDLVLADSSLCYCEGFALFKGGGQPTIHAWVTDERGRAIDNTWPQPGVAYAGVPFKSLFVNITSLKNRAIISLIDDWTNGWPLRGDLGDRPSEWLEMRGRGAKRIC